jgi:hypothetical protein
MEDHVMDSEHAREFEEHGIQAFRIERGAEVLGTDGTLGTVEQIVVDGESGELQSLVVRGEAGMFMEMPATRIDSATGEQVYLSLSRADLAAHPELARPFKPEMYIPVDEGAVVPPGEVVNRDPEAPILTDMEEDAIEIAAPASDETAADAEMAGGNAEDLDIAEQPTIVLGPDDAPMQRTAQQPAATADAGVVGPGAAEMMEPDALSLGDERLDLEPSDAESGMGAFPDLTPEPLEDDDAEIASLAEVETVTMPPLDMADTSDTADIAPRVPGGAACGNPPERDLGMYVTAGILAATAAASIGYLYWSRRQRTSASRLPSLSAARAQMESARQSVAGLAPYARDVSSRGVDVAARARSSAAGLWGLMAERGVDLGAALGGLASLRELTLRRTRDAARNLPSAGDMRDMRDTLSSRLPTVDTGSLRSRAGAASSRVQDLLDDAADAVRGWRPDLMSWMRLGTSGGARRLALPWLRLRSGQTPTMKAAGQAATQTAKKASETRRAARKGMQRVGRRVRWFRRGMLAGAVWGILYAPVPGREARTAAAGYLSRVPYLRDYIGSATQPSGDLGSSGPRPRSDIASSHAPYPGAPAETPLLEPTSEEPLLPAPDSDIGSLPGATPAL